MSGSGKGLLGLWLYRSGEEWTIKQSVPKPVSICWTFMKKKSVSVSLLAKQWKGFAVRFFVADVFGSLQGRCEHQI
ncbi:hypothetical protein J6590_027820 [Homalodisca vitripennis]|nr:hypothetical protein J6590_027820 [Homalodisca vitripennis]